MSLLSVWMLELSLYTHGPLLRTMKFQLFHPALCCKCPDRTTQTWYHVQPLYSPYSLFYGREGRTTTCTEG